MRFKEVRIGEGSAGLSGAGRLATTGREMAVDAEQDSRARRDGIGDVADDLIGHGLSDLPVPAAPEHDNGGTHRQCGHPTPGNAAFDALVAVRAGHAAPGRGAHGFGRQCHDSVHIGVASGGSGTANAFSRNETSV